MSADNYMLVRKDGERFVVTMEFASDREPGRILPGDRRFDKLEDAMSYANGVRTEYGVNFESGVLPEWKGDTK